MATESEAKIKHIIQRTHNIKSFRLEVKDKVEFKPGQFLFVALKVEKEIRKPFTISNSPTEKGYIEFTKKITSSIFSLALDKLQPGDTLKIKYPFGKFTFEGEYEKIAFLSGGIGITPVRSIVKYVIDKNLGTDMILLYGNHTIKDIAFQEDFDHMQKGYSKLKVVHILSEAESKWKGRIGFIDNQIIKEEIPDYKKRKFYICGPPSMIKTMKKILLDELVLPKVKIILENFTGY
jgi:ferredoxin-NADP reductase